MARTQSTIFLIRLRRSQCHPTQQNDCVDVIARRPGRHSIDARGLLGTFPFFSALRMSYAPIGACRCVTISSTRRRIGVSCSCSSEQTFSAARIIRETHRSWSCLPRGLGKLGTG